VAFASWSRNLVRRDTNDLADVFVRDRVTRTTERVSVATGGRESQQRIADCPAISGDGRFVAFNTGESLEHGDRGYYDVYVRDRLKGTTERISLTSDGHAAHGDCWLPSISRDGRTIAFASGAEDLVSGDNNGDWDVFVHDAVAAKTFEVCEPGAAGVRDCPCSNPPSGARRGCDNSAGTGGATLQASGASFLSADDLVFQSGGEVSGVPSFLVQGSAPMHQGAVYGQGVRCIGGEVKRLYTRRAVNGTAILPDLESGESPISLRSASLGDVIHAGESRWYLVQYRDPIVLGGCPATSTFNSTPTVMVEWWY
jgi:hypothetical protein